MRAIPYCTGANQWHVELDGGKVQSGFKDFASVMRWIKDYRINKALEDLL